MIAASHFTQNKAEWPNFEQSRRCWCRHKAFLLPSMTSLTHGRIAAVLPDACFRDALYKRNTVQGAARLFLLPSVLRSPTFVSLYSGHIQHFQLRRGWSLFPSPNCPPIPAAQCCKETFWPIGHPVPLQSHSKALTLQHSDVVDWTKSKGMFLDPIFSKLPGKTSLEKQPFGISSCPHTAQHWLSLPQRNS